MKFHRKRRFSRKEKNRKCARIFARQSGVIGASQALQAGLSQRAIERRIGSGLWETILPSVYRLAGATPTWRQRLFAAVLWGGDGAVISHRAAAALWELENFRAGWVELTLPHRTTVPVDWIVVHYSGRLSEVDYASQDGPPVTTVARTLCDLGAVVRPWKVQVALDHALRMRMTTSTELASHLARIGGRGCRGVGVLRALLEDPLQGTVAPGSPLERRFVGIIAEAGIPEPVRQFPIYDTEGIIGRLDFAWPDVRLGLEVDGFSAHSSRRSFHHDRLRENRLTHVGWRLIHATAEDARSPEQLKRLLHSRGPGVRRGSRRSLWP